MTAKLKVCKECEKETYLWARGMCKSCDRKVNPHKHGIQPKKLSEIQVQSELEPNDRITKNDVENYIKLEKYPTVKKRPLRGAKNTKSTRGKRYKELCEEKFRNVTCCQACYEQTFLTNSHRIPERFRPDLVDEYHNLDRLCIPCHQDLENWNFKRFKNSELKEEIINYVRATDLDYYQRKEAQAERNKNL